MRNVPQLVLLGAVVLMLIALNGMGRSDRTLEQVSELRRERDQLLEDVSALRRQLASKRAREAREGGRSGTCTRKCCEALVSASSESPPPSETKPPLSPSELASESDPLLAIHTQWDWPALASELLQPFGVVSQQQLSQALSECFKNDTMYCLRAQVVGGKLFITDYRAIFFDRHARRRPATHARVAAAVARVRRGGSLAAGATPPPG